MKQSCHPLWLVGGIVLYCLVATSPTRAQIVPDSTLPVNSIVTPGGNTTLITGGTVAGSNLFHSFEQFSIPTGSTAFFNNAEAIQNIISRVTGGSVSNIDGLIRANGTANVFLLNPNGIIFGPNASLSIGGSILASTASSLNFADGTQFSATASKSTPLLTVSVPIGLQFAGTAGRILVQGPGNNLSVGPPPTLAFVRGENPVGLQVQPGKTLALVGGDVTLEGGNLIAQGGRIEVGSVAAPGLVSLTSTDFGWTLGYENVTNFRDIQLSRRASVDASGVREASLEEVGGGDIQVQGRHVTLTEGSAIFALTLGPKSGGTLTVNASDSVELIGTSAVNLFPSALFTDTEGAGAAGDLTINTRQLIVRDGAEVTADTLGAGDAGSLTVNASDSVELIGTSGAGEFLSGLFTTGNAGDAGAAGDLTINTRQLLIRDGAQVSTSTLGAGDAGSLTVNATDSVELVGTSADGQLPSGLFADTLGAGAAGALTINTGQLLVRNGSQVSSYTKTFGNAGSLTVNASDSVELIGTSADGEFLSGLFANTLGAGAAGALTINTGQLLVRDGAEILNSTRGAGDAGSLTVNASDSVELIGESADGQFASGLFAQTQDAGAAGALTINTGQLLVRDGAVVSSGTSTGSTGPGGTLAVTASDFVELSGTSTSDSQFPSGLFTQTRGTGPAGNLTIATGRLIVQNGAVVTAGTGNGSQGKGGTLVVTASSVELSGTAPNGQDTSGLFARTRGTGPAGDLTVATGQLIVRDRAQITVSGVGSGDAGNIKLTARSIRLENLGKLTATTASGQGGDIKLQDLDLLLLRRGSEISTTAGLAGTGGNGGNIDITSDLIVAVPEENSDITANAFTGRGGRVQITAQGIFGLVPRSLEELKTLLETDDPNQLDPAKLPSSDITTISQTDPSLSGQVTINTLDIDPSRGLINLPAQPTDTSVVQACQPGGSQDQSEFVITGRGGLPPNPNEALSSDAIEVDWVTLNPGVENRSSPTVSTNPTAPEPAPIVEAQGWVIGDNGEVVLTATAPNAKPHNPWMNPATCHTPETSS